MQGTKFEDLTNVQIEQHIDFYNSKTKSFISYIVKKEDDQYYCKYPNANDIIFKYLKIEKKEFQKRLLGYTYSGIFPYCDSLEDLGLMLKELWKLYYQNIFDTLDFNILCPWPRTLRLMCQLQMEQGNPVNPEIFLEKFIASAEQGGFDWGKTPYEDMFITMDSISEPKDKDRIFDEYIKSLSESIEKQHTITIKTKHHAIELQDKKASVRRGNLPEGSRKTGRESKTAISCGHLRNRICHS